MAEVVAFYREREKNEVQGKTTHRREVVLVTEKSWFLVVSFIYPLILNQPVSSSAFGAQSIEYGGEQH